MTKKQLLGLLDFAHLLVDALESLQVPYMLGGALAVMAYVEARATQDVDLVIHLPIESAVAFSKALAQIDIPIPEELIRERFARSEQDLPLSGIHRYSGQRADIYLQMPGDDLRAQALSRRRKVDLGPILGDVYVHAPEDLILYKLSSFAIREQGKHVRDIAAIVLAMETSLEMDYLTEWVRNLGLTHYWQQICAETERLRSGND